MFNSRNPVYRDPTGAVADGTRIHFRISMPRDHHCSAARLTVRDDASGAERTLGMFWCGMNGENYEWWECHYTPEKPGLFFYWFSVDTWRGTLRMTRGFGGEGTVQSSDGGVWQLTVYERGFTTPDWLAGGVMYQIFPDRFFPSGQKKEGVPAGRTLRADWGGQPGWEPDAKGEITNADYFCGDLAGVERKLAYLKSLGVTCIYFNPIFEAHSNHRYNTADYSKIDPLLGTREDFTRLCRRAGRLGIRVILDGVFNHTGSDSVYFNREGRYPGPGAYQSQGSQYYPWYHFRRWPDDYECWWGFRTLPNVDETNPQFEEYVNGAHGIIRKWIAAGASGWRLDVADELPDPFLERLRAAAKAENPEALVLGEVWEDASNKTAYGVRRKYLLGNQLDSVMNYPFRSAVLGFLTDADPADMMEIIRNVLENYPPQVVRVLMNHIGTHDTERALTALAGEPLRGHGRRWQSTAHLTRERRRRGLRLMRLASLMQFTLPGVPCIYYGDEVGMEGYRDPFNRACYPWGKEDRELLGWYRMLGRMRAELPVLKEGEFVPVAAGNGCMAYLRRDRTGALLCACNAGVERRSLSLPREWADARVLTGAPADANGDLTLEPESGTALFLPARPDRENA